jgi:hypothetical protein
MQDTNMYLGQVCLSYGHLLDYRRKNSYSPKEENLIYGRSITKLLREYGGLNHICRQIEYDVKHGVTDKEVIHMVRKVRDDSQFFELRKGNGSMQRLKEIESQFTKSGLAF